MYTDDISQANECQSGEINNEHFCFFPTYYEPATVVNSLHILMD